ncbi:MAG: tRNA (adenosine(37)-N6)-threonylcarbamoyltransferase complex transferase subunit TsaD, partial [Phycisphaerae bacterium]|nr:tRNA (adenosine(37)-N6)-threonylcarbamoyltransferase complex transferase subunit TsaD [Phycisphaerae bacterium]
MLILGIETSCDETAAAVVKNGAEILSSVVFSQVDIHARFGGVIPEIASRNHIRKILPVIDEAFKIAGIAPGEIDAIAVTTTPGLIGALLVGLSVAKGLSLSLEKPLISVSHLDAHLSAINLTGEPVEPPYVALLASGGHSQLYLSKEKSVHELIGTTLDDAAGEALDKIAKLLGLGYPGGAIIEKTAKGGDRKKFIFPVVMPKKDNFDMSFSGLKTKAATIIKQQCAPKTELEMKDFCASFQYAIIGTLARKSFLAAKHF